MFKPNERSINMNPPIKVCIEKLVPESGNELAVTNFWPQGKTLRIHFFGGDPVVREKVKHYASAWLPYVNIKFAFVEDPTAEIRVAFMPDGSSWSALGTDGLNKRYFPKETMNFGWLTSTTEDEEYSRVVIHEFGHALGCIHEHQNPAGGIPWNKDAVYRYYFDTQGWSEGIVDQNIFRKWDRDQTQYSEFDEESIMLYPIPKELTLNGYEVGWNRDLSDVDKRFISKVYHMA